MINKLTALTLTTALCCTAAPVLAQSKGDITLGFGLGAVIPNGSDSTVVPGQIDVDSNVRPTLTFEYFVADNIGIEVLAAWPFEHDINLVGTGQVGDTKHLPPTISVQYHFTNSSSITPFVGVGVNYTFFFDEGTEGALAGQNLSLDDSFGIALHAGLDFAVSDRGAFRADIRWIDIDTEASVNGVPIGTVNIDPIVVGASYVLKF